MTFPEEGYGEIEARVRAEHGTPAEQAAAIKADDERLRDVPSALSPEMGEYIARNVEALIANNPTAYPDPEQEDPMPELARRITHSIRAGRIFTAAWLAAAAVAAIRGNLTITAVALAGVAYYAYIVHTARRDLRSLQQDT